MRIKKSFLTVLFIFIAIIGFSATAHGAEDSIFDDADLFSDDEIARLKEELLPIENKAKARVYIATTNNNTYSSAQEYADYFLLDRIGTDSNGIVFLIDMDTREFYISTSGNMIDYITDRRIDSSLDAIEPSMINGNYGRAAEIFLEKTSEYVAAGVPGGHYRIDSETGKITYYKVITTTEAIIAFVLAAVVAIVIVVITISKYQLKFGKYNYNYRENSSGKILSRNDVLVNSFVTTRRIPRNNGSSGGRGGRGGGGSTTHRTGGGSFGGGGRSF